MLLGLLGCTYRLALRRASGAHHVKCQYIRRYNAQTRKLKPGEKPQHREGHQRNVNPLTDAQKALNRKRNQERKVARADTMDEALEQVSDIATGLSDKLGDHDSKFYMRELMQQSKIKVTRSGQAWNAFQSIAIKRHNNALPEGVPKLRSRDLQEELLEAYRALSDSQKQEYLDEFNKAKAERPVQRNQAISNFRITEATVQRLVKEAQSLKARTGTEVLIMAVRSGIEQYNRPFAFATSERMEMFFKMLGDANLNDLAIRLEGYLMSGVQGVLESQKEKLVALRKDTATLILDSLRKAAGCQVPKMQYQSFYRIMRDYEVVVEGWPHPEFKAPSQFRSVIELEILFNAWKTGTAKFRKMSKEEYKQWREQQTADGDDSDDSDEDVPAAHLDAGLNVPDIQSADGSSDAPFHDMNMTLFHDANLQPVDNMESGPGNMEPFENADMQQFDNFLLSMANGAGFDGFNNPLTIDNAVLPAPSEAGPSSAAGLPAATEMASTSGQGRRSKRGPRAPLTNVTGVTLASGATIPVEKTKRKPRADKGKPRKKRRVEP